MIRPIAASERRRDDRGERGDGDERHYEHAGSPRAGVLLPASVHRDPSQTDGLSKGGYGLRGDLVFVGV